MARGKTNVNYLNREGFVAHTDAPNWDFLYDASTVKDSNWNLSDRVVLPDGRVFRYGKCGNSLTYQKNGVKNYNPVVTGKHAIATVTLAGAKTIDITFADTDGVAENGVIAKDELRGGFIHIYVSSTVRENRGIIGNTARANGDTGDTTIYLDAPLKTAVGDNAYVEVLGNPYSDLRQVEQAVYTSVMGMPNVLATTGQYFWIQTWGILRINCTDTNDVINGRQYDREYVFDANGGIVLRETDVTTRSYQRAGFLVERSGIGVTSENYPAPFINLQINP